jgi:hypothetical protein
MKIGVQIQPQGTSMADLRKTWEQADAVGVDLLRTWDHFLCNSSVRYGVPTLFCDS